ncbi:MAG: dioxygenase [Gammaproteobacteria bacterium]|nr:dioxygenase [Gammaproteobacteria bacterium]MCP4881048.1 dioxygenase [Gammaproteobacteria bacterium]
MARPFHFAFKVKDLVSTRLFYMQVMGCVEGRSTDTWVDFDLYGNQLSAHVGIIEPLDYCGCVDGVKVPIPHFGCVLTKPQFDALQGRFEVANIEFIVQPQQRYEGQVGQQRIMFVLDYSGNPLEFKCMTNDEELFLA